MRMQKIGLCAGMLTLGLLGACATTSQETGTEHSKPADDKSANVTAEQNDAIDALFRRKAPALQRCWQEEYERAQNRKLEGDITLSMVVTTKGNATELKVVHSTIGVPAVDKCVTTEVQSWLFPEGPGNAPYRRTVHLGAAF